MILSIVQQPLEIESWYIPKIGMLKFIFSSTFSHSLKKLVNATFH